MTTEPTRTGGSCPECGAVVDGGRAACQKLFDEVLAKEFGDYRYSREHRLTVDVYSLQHPAEYMRSAKSYAAHLTGIYAALEEDAATTNRAVQQWLSGPRDLARPDDPPPRQRGTLAITHVHQADDPDEHVRCVREWAESTWDAWRDYHNLAKQWVVEATAKQAV